VEGGASEPFYTDVKSVVNSEEKYVFLVGAGVSMEAPSCIPSARELVKSLASVYAPQEALDALLALPNLRYEMLAEQIQAQADKELSYLDYFNDIKAPNLIHLFLAHAIVNGHDVITTNFDYMIERALMQVLPVDRHADILPVITKDDFLNNKDPSALHAHGKFPVYKIHGSKLNIVTGEKTTESLVTTISALGKNREKGKTFALEQFKQPAYANIVLQRTLVIMGYSGKDDFDIGPTLRSDLDIKQVIWIDHAATDRPSIFSFDNDRGVHQRFTGFDEMLEYIYGESMREVIKIAGKTISLVRDDLWPIILPGIPIPSIDTTNTPPSYKAWFEANAKPVPFVQQFLVTNEVLLAAGDYDNGKRLSEIAVRSPSPEVQAYGYIYIGTVWFCKGDLPRARECYERSLQLFEQLRNVKYTCRSLALLGQVVLSMGKFDEAYDIEMRGLQLCQASGNLDEESACHSNLSVINEARGQIDMAIQQLARSVEINEATGNLRLKSIMINNLGNLYLRQKNYDLALNYLKDAHAISVQLGESHTDCGICLSIAETYINKRSEEAFSWIEAARQIARPRGLDNLLVQAFHLEARDLVNRGAPHDAIAVYDKSISLAEKSRLPSDVAFAHVQAGHIHWRMKDYPAALKRYNLALDIVRAQGNETIAQTIQKFIANTPPKP
jgi:tetratricopeptide (TPR) repeat protein